jgi:phosphoglycolate/pyridoxal phosphate phosphatase family enzyme
MNRTARGNLLRVMALELGKYDCLFFDCDGVIWSGKDPIPGSIPALLSLQSLNKRLLFVTNNSIYSQQQLASRLTVLGFPCSPGQVFCPGVGVGVYLRAKHPFVSKVVLIGGFHLRNELINQGYAVIHSSDFAKIPPTTTVEELLLTLRVEEGVGAVVVALQFDFNYQIACFASKCLQRGAVLIAANADKFALAGDDVRMPGGYALVRFLEESADIKAEIVGKPSAFFFQWAQFDSHLNPKRCLMVGDTLETDIAFANNCGMDSVLVLSGVSTEAEAREQSTATYILPNLASLLVGYSTI